MKTKLRPYKPHKADRVELFAALAKQWIKDGSPAEAKTYAILAVREARKAKSNDR